MKEWILNKRWRIIFAGMLIATAPLLALSAYVYLGLGSDLEARLMRQNQDLAQFTARTIEEKLKSEISYARSFAARFYLLEGMMKGDRRELRRHLKSLIEINNTIERAFITDRAGVQLANWPYTPETVGVNFSERDWYKGVSKNWAPYVSEFYMRKALPQRYLFAIAVPMVYRGEVVGTLVMQPKADVIKNAIGGIIDKNDKGHIYALDRRGHLIYHPRITLDRIIDFSDSPMVQRAMSGQEGVEHTLCRVDNGPSISAYHPVAEWGWSVVVEKPKDAVFGPVRRMGLWVFGMTGVMLLVGGYFSYRGAGLFAASRKAEETIRKNAFELQKSHDELEARVRERTAELARVNRVLKTLSECNQALMRAPNEETLLKDICRIIVEIGGYRTALIGFAERDEEKSIRVAAAEGYEEGFFSATRLTWADVERGRGPLGNAIREVAVSVYQDITSDKYPAVWREAAIKRGYGSAIGLPLTRGQEVFGALAIYATGPSAFDEKEVNLLKELAADTSYGVTAHRTREERKGLEEHLIRHGRELKFLSESTATLLMLPTSENVYEAICEIATKIFDLRVACLFIIGEDGSVSPVAQSGSVSGDDAVTRFVREDAGRKNGFSRTAMRAQTPRVVDDLALENEWPEWSAAALSLGCKSAIAMPLISSEAGAVGCLALYAARPDCFIHDRLDILRVFANYVSSVIENRGLIDKLEKKVRERTLALESSNNELYAVNRELVERRRDAEEAKHQADAASKAKSDFLANMSHELRTPLNSVIGFSEILQDGMFGKLNEKQQDYVNNIHGSGKHLLNLINDILDLSKVEAGKMELELSRFFLRDELNASLSMLKEKAMKHGIRLDCEIDPEADIELEADERRLKQIMYNLLSNAVKFTPEGGSVRVSARRVQRSPDNVIRGQAPFKVQSCKDKHVEPGTLNVEPDADFIEISVQDTGIGIAPEDLPKLFKEFSQLESVYSKTYEGTGLGLALTKKLVALHNGRIWCESEFGKGSRFTFVIPAGRGKSSPRAPKTGQAGQAP